MALAPLRVSLFPFLNGIGAHAGMDMDSEMDSEMEMETEPSGNDRTVRSRLS